MFFFTSAYLLSFSLIILPFLLFVHFYTLFFIYQCTKLVCHVICEILYFVFAHGAMWWSCLTILSVCVKVFPFVKSCKFMVKGNDQHKQNSVRSATAHNEVRSHPGRGLFWLLWRIFLRRGYLGTEKGVQESMRIPCLWKYLREIWMLL